MTSFSTSGHKTFIFRILLKKKIKYFSKFLLLFIILNLRKILVKYNGIMVCTYGHFNSWHLNLKTESLRKFSSSIIYIDIYVCISGKIQRKNVKKWSRTSQFFRCIKVLRFARLPVDCVVCWQLLQQQNRSCMMCCSVLCWLAGPILILSAAGERSRLHTTPHYTTWLTLTGYTVHTLQYFIINIYHHFLKSQCSM